MKYLLTILLTLVIIGTAAGFYLKPDDPATGDFLIGLSMAVAFFVLMPLFIFHRWKNRDVRDYMLTKENIDKMNEYNRKRKK